ncbi:MAG: NACHT domain-containing protein, partial [Clostridium sp.]
MEYIERKLGKYIFKTENLEITDSNINDREYSKNEILENKISLIVGESGRGKSSFLKNIEKEVENSIYKELVSLDYENNFEFEDEKIYLLDSIDEDRNEESEKTYNKKLRKIIDEIKALNSENRIILTCREGYIPNEIVKKYEIDVYKLLPITQEQINLVLGEEKEQFWDFIKKSNLEEHLGNIVILQTLIKNYKNYKTEVTISEIYMNLCKNFLEIETENEVSFIGENHDEIMEELSILMSSKYFLKEKFPNESLELNNKKLEKNKKEKLSKVPIFIGEKKEYRVYHKSIEEFLIAFYFHKKIEYKELDIEEIISIFFNESYLKIELKDIFKFLIYFENDEFKRILLEIDPTLLIEIRENNKNMQKLILLKNISILKKNP